MKIIKTKCYDEMSKYAANIIAAQAIVKPTSLFGFATGSTPLGTYNALIEKNKAEDVDFSGCRTVNLDEYVGLPRDNDQSYYYYMHTNFFDKINIAPENTHLPNGMAADIDAELKAYDELIASMGGIDLQLLGLGHDGHIGFNEPSDHFSKGTNCVALTEMTIEANKRFFASANDVPRKALTMGMREIMQAKKIVFIVSGEDKAEILYKSVYGDITPEVPASILQLHPDVTLIADEAAMKIITEKGLA